MKKNINFGDAIHQGLTQAMKLDKKVVVYGLGIGKTSNVYGTTSGLVNKFGKKRVFDTPSSESALTAMATGMAITGLRPILIHQRFDFMLYSMDQIVNWISLWSYKSSGKSTLPLTIRAVIGKGWGQGPQHGKSLHSWFSNIPGLSVVFPSSPYEAKGLILSSVFSNFPTIIFESRSIYAMKEEVPVKPYFINPTKSFIREKGTDITLVAFGSSVSEAMTVSRILKDKGIKAEILDLRAINPIDKNTIIKSVKKTKRLAVIENGWPNCSIASEIISICCENINLRSRPLKFCWQNTHIPTSHKLEKNFYLNPINISKNILKNF